MLENTSKFKLCGQFFVIKLHLCGISYCVVLAAVTTCPQMITLVSIVFQFKCAHM